MCGCHDLTCVGGCGCGCTHTLKMHDYAIRREAEAHLRKQVAQEIEALMCDPSTCKDRRAERGECNSTNAKWELAASIARGQK